MNSHGEGFDATRVAYSRGLVWFFAGMPLLFTVVAALAWRDTEASGGPQWLVFVIGLPLVSAWVIWRTRDAAVTISADGRLRRRSVTGDQAANLANVSEVMVMPSVAYEDQLGTHHQPNYGYVVRDTDGGFVSIARRGPWPDISPVLAQIAHALHQDRGRCDPITWEFLHRDAGLAATTTFPERLTHPPEGSWSTPLTIPRRQRTSTLVSLFAFAAFPMIGAVPGFLGMISDQPGQALTALFGGLLTTGVFWGLLWQVIRRGDRDRVVIAEDGGLQAVTRRTRWLTLGYRLDEGSVDLTRLRRAQVVPGSWTHESKRDQPQWWRLDLEDTDGGFAGINLMHPRTPRATLFPQLAYHVERADIELDELTRRAIRLRLGRPLADARPAA